MENKQLLSSLELLSKIDDYISEYIEFDLFLPKIFEEIKSYLNCEQVFISYFNLEGGEEFIFDRSFKVNLDDFKQVLKKSFQEKNKIEKFKKNQYYSNSQSIRSNQDESTIPVMKSELIFPIFIQTPEVYRLILKDLWGLLLIYDYQPDRIWKKEEIETLQLITKQIVLAVERSLIYQELQLKNQQLEENNLFDSLTQLPNYKSFIDCLEFEWFRLAREKDFLSLILISLEGINTEEKSIIFPQVAKLLSESAKRPSDLSARYSDNQFVVVLPHTNEAGVNFLMNKIQMLIKKTIENYEHINLKTYCLTSIPNPNHNYDKLLESIENTFQNIK